MGKFRKAIASLSLVAILSTLIVSTTAFAADVFKDVPSTHWFNEFAQKAVDLKVADGTKTEFFPDKDINRAELVKMVVAGAGISTEGLSDFPAGVYTDVKKGEWYEMYVKAALQNNIVTSKATFAPLDKSNRAQAAKVI